MREEMDLFLFLKHLQHAVGNGKAAHYVERTKKYCQNTQHQLQRKFRNIGMTYQDDASDDDDATDGVGTRHKRCVKHRRNVADNLDAQKTPKVR